MRVREFHTWFWWGNLRERDSVEGPSVDRSVILKMVLKYIGLEIVDWINP